RPSTRRGTRASSPRTSRRRVRTRRSAPHRITKTNRGEPRERREEFVERLQRAASCRDGFDELGDDRGHALRGFDELDARAVEDELLLDVGDGAVRDPAFDDNGKLAEGQPELVKGIELEGKAGFDLRAA